MYCNETDKKEAIKAIFKNNKLTGYTAFTLSNITGYDITYVQNTLGYMKAKNQITAKKGLNGILIHTYESIIDPVSVGERIIKHINSLTHEESFTVKDIMAAVKCGIYSAKKYSLLFRKNGYLEVNMEAHEYRYFKLKRIPLNVEAEINKIKDVEKITPPQEHGLFVCVWRES